jgi:hypothetical protein
MAMQSAVFFSRLIGLQKVSGLTLKPSGVLPALGGYNELNCNQPLLRHESQVTDSLIGSNNISWFVAYPGFQHSNLQNSL